MRKLGFLPKVFVSVGIVVAGTMPTLIFGDNPTSGQKTFSAFAGLGGAALGTIYLTSAVATATINAVRRALAKKERVLEDRALALAAELQDTQVELLDAPRALAKVSGSEVLRQAAEGIDAAYSAWSAVVENHPNLEQRRFAHAMRTIQETCQDKMQDPILMKSEAAHERLAATMNALSHEMLDDLREVEEDRLQALSISLSTLERQVSLEIDPTDKVRT